MVGPSRVQQIAVQWLADCPVDWIEDGWVRLGPLEERFPQWKGVLKEEWKGFPEGSKANATATTIGNVSVTLDTPWTDEEVQAILRGEVTCRP